MTDKLAPADLSKLLRYAADLVDANDSLEGSLEWHPSPGFGMTFDVTAAIREGNSAGQGGMITI